MMNAGQEITQQVVQILQDPVLSRVHFRVEGIPVYGSWYSTLARAITDRHVTVKMVDLPSSIGAEYRSRINWQGQSRNKIVIPPDFNASSADSRQAVIHEATHALADYHRRPISAYREEAASYIAGSMYVQLKFGTTIQCRTSTQNPLSLFVMAARAARSILERNLYDVDPQDLRRLISMIRRDSVYSDLNRTSVYGHDGL